MEISSRKIGSFNGEDVCEYTITNAEGMSISAMSYGASITALNVPDYNGKIKNVALSLDSVDDYITHRPFYGATVGRVAGRIANGEFELNGDTVQVETNEKGNQLHGGPKGLDTVNWDTHLETETDEAAIVFTTVDQENNNGYPGNLKVKVKYILTQANEWKVEYEAETDKATLFNPTNHTYFNLTGDFTQTILNHQLKLRADKFAPIQEAALPTGEFEEVNGTPFDFRSGAEIKQGVQLSHPQTELVGGFDHPFVLNHESSDPEAVLTDPISGRRIKMFTDQDSVVIFTHNGTVDKYTVQGHPAYAYCGITLETQALPDAINQENFGSIILNPGEIYRAQTIYQFDAIDPLSI
ncbi:aldose epimerase family protein [Lacticigenium naphthae]|uniref:aldose epimerase family protein n=1 Tax=Lacticigenium naphthae TaxID=515351 RepID=UPI000411C2E0|nr:aldose epimerase family protein [Lacticigenium naphthae]